MPRNVTNGGNYIWQVFGNRNKSLQEVRCLKTHVQVTKDDHEMDAFCHTERKTSQGK